MSSVLAPGGFVREPQTLLRNYPRDNPYAAARIVAAALLSNGSVKAVESAALDALKTDSLLGLARNEWSEVISHLRHDLLHACEGEELVISRAVIDCLLQDLDDQELQRIVTALCVVAIHADMQLERNEQSFLQALQETWGLATSPAASVLVLREHANSISRPRPATQLLD